MAQGNTKGGFAQRKLKIEFDVSTNVTQLDANGNYVFKPFQDGSEIVTLDETLDIRCEINRSSSAIQSTAEIVVANLSTTTRQTFSRRVNAYLNGMSQQLGSPGNFVPVMITAGYASSTSTDTAVIFQGQAFNSAPLGEFPNAGMRFTAATRQIDKSRTNTATPPSQMTYGALVAWVANVIGVPYVCQTQYANQVITNPLASGSIFVGALIYELKACAPARANVEVFIDESDTLIVRDLGATIMNSAPVTVDELIGVPGTTEYGVHFRTLMNTKIRLITAVNVKSITAPWMGFTPWTPFHIKYTLASRSEAFYMDVDAAPPANAASPFGPAS